VKIGATQKVPSSLASAGVVAINDYQINTGGRQLLVPSPLPGKLVYVLASPQLGGPGTVASGESAAGDSTLEVLDLATGRTSEIGPRQFGWSIENLFVEGSFLVWLEVIRGPNS
jgi:hypothetical protein